MCILLYAVAYDMWYVYCYMLWYMSREKEIEAIIRNENLVKELHH